MAGQNREVEGSREFDKQGRYKGVEGECANCEGVWKKKERGRKKKKRKSKKRREEEKRQIESPGGTRRALRNLVPPVLAILSAPRSRKTTSFPPGIVSWSGVFRPGPKLSSWGGDANVAPGKRKTNEEIVCYEWRAKSLT
ncbi:unnamed protein product [Nezara viridula]|uniref:Uncharacterized protein n=1 Tax=Nezara viridula TaxID=85310 RepID=A0A9P0HGF4_NEZVI|nr:unnamed protein product [Nezara viridula]